MKKGLLYLLALVLLVSSVSAEYYPYDYPQYPQPTYPYGGGYFGGIGNFDFNSLYDNYHLFMDAIIFGFIFFGLGSIVWAGKQGYTPLYIGLGLFLTASLLLFEARSNIRLLDIAGPWAITVLILLLAMAVYKISKELIGSTLFSVGLAAISGIWLIGQLSDRLGGIPFLSDLMSNSQAVTFFMIVAGVAIVAGVVKHFKLAATKP